MLYSLVSHQRAFLLSRGKRTELSNQMGDGRVEPVPHRRCALDILVVISLLLTPHSWKKTKNTIVLRVNLLPVASKAFPSVIASFVCWSLGLVYALTQRGRWRTLFFLGSLVQLRCGEGGRDAANK